MLPWTGYQGPTSPKLVIMTAWVSFFAIGNLVPDGSTIAAAQRPLIHQHGATQPLFEDFFQGRQSFCSALIFKHLSVS